MGSRSMLLKNKTAVIYGNGGFGVAVFAAGDLAALITGTAIDVTAGTTAALSYKTSQASPYI